MAGTGRKIITPRKKKVGQKPSDGNLFEKESLKIVEEALDSIEKGFSGLPVVATRSGKAKRFRSTLMQIAERMRDNYPYFHPLYAGQMLKPPHPIARAAYMLSMWINPNNHALDGGRASSQMEKEAVAELANMFGWSSHVGHLTGGGTMANLEALWVAGRINPGKKIVASDQAHYTHSRISGVLGLNFETIPADSKGRMDIGALKKVLEGGDVGTVVATIGTTAVGSVDPLPGILELKDRYGFRLHADAAYGGYFILTSNLEQDAVNAFTRLHDVDSIVIDPHKHGLQPYGCGCVIFRDPTVARFYKHNSPYTYFTSADLHLGEISLECSRAGASAVALWATQKFLPLKRGGEFSKSLEAGRSAALNLFQKLDSDKRFITAFPPELDIVVWAPFAENTEKISGLSRSVFNEAAKKSLHIALVDLPASFFDLDALGVRKDANTLTCLRSVLMKPEHEQWIERIWKILDKSMDIALSGKS